MRVVSPPPVAHRLRPVSPARPAEDAAAWKLGAAGRAAPSPAADADDNVLPFRATAGAPSSPVTRTALVAQDVGAAGTARPEGSVIHASRAYLQVDDMRFRHTPFSLRVA